ncbi:hypothetical protein WS68_05480 [Burkholderia sp. TSV86]|nr:hypothetical protein WS68_05480 [Burkholderia sp. TSV86]
MRAFSFGGKLRLTIQRQIVQVNIALTSYDVLPIIVRQELSELRAIALLVVRDTAQFSPFDEQALAVANVGVTLYISQR